MMRNRVRRRGWSAVELVISLVVLGILFLYLLVAIPKSRETARGTTCRGNLKQIGVALGLYQQSEETWPTVALNGESPITAMLGRFGVADFEALDDGKVVPKSPSPTAVAAHRIRGLICPSDPNAMSTLHPAPTNYRASTGDTTDGLGGAFAVGRSLRLSQVEDADGAAFTAAYSERMVGGGAIGPDDFGAYGETPGLIDDKGCVGLDWSALKGDAGASWLKATWPSTLYNHAAPPDARPTCVSVDGRTAWIGASSAHADGVNVLLLDGSLRTYRPSVAPRIWKALATTGAIKP